MGTFAFERRVAVAPRQVWDVVTDWAGYSRWVPLTIMRCDPGPTRVGWSFAGLTGVGRLRFADVMRVTEWAPPSGAGPGSFRLVKVGRLLAGWAEVRVLPIEGGEVTRLLWRESILVRPAVLGRLVAPVTDRFNRVLFARVVDAMAAEAVRVSDHRSPGPNSSGPNFPGPESSGPNSSGWDGSGPNAAG